MFIVSVGKRVCNTAKHESKFRAFSIRNSGINCRILETSSHLGSGLLACLVIKGGGVTNLFIFNTFFVSVAYHAFGFGVYTFTG